MKLFFTLIFVSFSLVAGTAATKNEDGSFKLSAVAEKNMKIGFKKLNTKGPWTVPQDSLVKIKFTTGVYRRFEGDITLVLVNVLKTENGSVLLQSEDLDIGDEVAIKGAHFLRLAEADLNSGTVDNCSH